MGGVMARRSIQSLSRMVALTLKTEWTAERVFAVFETMRGAWVFMREGWRMKMEMSINFCNLV
jgi:hypothetical protein